MTHAEEIIEKAIAKFKENDAYYEMMQELGCLKVDEQVHFDTGDDWYPSTHTFICLKDPSILLTGQTELGFLQGIRKMFS